MVHTQETDHDDQKADLVNLVFDLARELRAKAEESSGAMPLTLAEGAVLRRIAAAPGIQPARLAAQAHMQRSNLSSTLSSLVRKGLIKKRPSAGDARGVDLFPSGLALQHMEAFRKARAEIISGAIGTASPDLTAALETLRIIRDGLAGP